MRQLGTSGVWELFVPDVGKGTRYKFALLGKDGVWREKADPLAQATEVPPATASVVSESATPGGTTTGWPRRASHHGRTTARCGLRGAPGLVATRARLRDRSPTSWSATCSISASPTWSSCPSSEHPYGGSWGYQVTSYFAPTARFGDPDDFRYLIDRLHQAGIGVILDWVPAHFPKDDFALARFDGTPLYEHPDPRWASTRTGARYVFDFGRLEVRNFLVANALYWLEEFHVDAHPGRRGGLDALPRLLPRARPVGRPTCTAVARTSRPSSSCRS